MKETIVITDGYTLNPGDLTWDAFERIGTVHLYDRTSQAEMPERCSEASVIVTNKTPVTAEVISGCKKLKVIVVTATGYNIVDTKAAAAAGIPVCNVPGYGTDSVAQHTFALLLELASHVGINAQSVAAGEWASCPDFCYSKKPVIEISGKKLGIIGYGRIGQKTADIARAFGMEVLYTSPSRMGTDPNAVEMEDLFRRADFISLHCPLTSSNAGFVNSELLSLMKPSAFIINTARGQLINEHDLAGALAKGVLAGAALDVLSAEPPPADHPLLSAPNCIITPHTAWTSFEARVRIMDVTINNIQSALEGRPSNRVN